MKKPTLLNMILAVCTVSANMVQAQTPTDAVMMKQRESCFALIYDRGQFDQYYEGTDLRGNGTIETVTRTTILPMIAIGIMDNLNLIVATPYVKTESSEPNGGFFAGANGFQDIGLSLKARFLNKEIGTGKLALLSTVGYSTPMTNYLSDYMPYSLGFGANELSIRAIGQYQLDNGFYARTTISYLWRGQTKAERDYYYNNGSYYTAWMDVPNAWHYNGTIGVRLLGNALKLEAAYTGSKCLSGDDIRKYNAPQPTNKVEFDQLSFNTQYYFKKIKGLGVLANYAQVISGRNTAKMQNIALGVTYQFKI